MSQGFESEDFTEDDGWTLPDGWIMSAGCSVVEEDTGSKLYVETTPGKLYTVSYTIVSTHPKHVAFLIPGGFSGMIDNLSVQEMEPPISPYVKAPVKLNKPRKRGWLKKMRRERR